MYAFSRSASFLVAATFVAGLAFALPAHAAGNQTASYDTAVSNCFGAMVLTDPEVKTKMYDGEGFNWTNDRDAQISDCMKKYGYQMEGPKSGRVGTGGAGGRNIAPQIIRNKFREEMIRYGGEEALARIDAGQDTTFIPDAILQQAQGRVKVPAGAGNNNTSGASPAQVMVPTRPIPPAQTSVTQMPLPTPAPASPPPSDAPDLSAPAPATADQTDAPKPPSAPKAPRPVPAAPTGGGKPIFLPH